MAGLLRSGDPQQHHRLAPGHLAASTVCRSTALHHVRRSQGPPAGAVGKAPIYQRSAVPSGGGPDGAVERLLASYGVSPPSAGNCLELLSSGVEAYGAFSARRKRAARHSHRDLYSGRRQGKPRPGRMPHAEGQRRRRRALLIDSLGSWRLRRRFLARLVAAGGEVVSFMPVLNVFRRRTNLRNHRKLVIVDSRAALTGGMNLAWPYVGPPGSIGLWQDLSVVVQGPAVTDLDSLFASDWKFATGRDPEARLLRLPISTPPDSSRRPFKSSPAARTWRATRSTNRCSP